MAVPSLFIVKNVSCFFCSGSGQGLEPVGKVCDPLAFGPLTDAGSDLVGDSAIDLLAALDGGQQALIGFVA